MDRAMRSGRMLSRMKSSRSCWVMESYTSGKRKGSYPRKQPSDTVEAMASKEFRLLMDAPKLARRRRWT